MADVKAAEEALLAAIEASAKEAADNPGYAVAVAAAKSAMQLAAALADVHEARDRRAGRVGSL